MNKLLRMQLIVDGQGLAAPITAKDVRPKALSECTLCNTGKLITIKGKIYTAEDKQPLVGATIANFSAKKRGVVSWGTTSMTDGSYSMEVYPNDDIEISYVGLKTIRLKANKLPSAIFMQESIDQLEGVTVFAPKVMSKVTVQPSLNKKVDKSNTWLWIGLLSLLLAGGAYYFDNQKEKK